MAGTGVTLMKFFHLLKHNVLSAIFLLLLPFSVQAHLVNTGLGPVYDGVSHLFLTPEDLLTAITLALYCGLLGASASRLGMFTFPVAWLLGGLFGLHITIDTSLPVAAFSFVLLGVLVAADLVIPKRFLMAVILLIGLVHGFFNGQALQLGPSEKGLIGTIVALFILMTLVSASVVAIKPAWMRIAVRVLGSWVSASGILLFGWYLKAMI